MNEYMVLRPIYFRTPYRNPETGEHYWRVDWLRIGQARDMADAKRQFGGSPVLQEITRSEQAWQ
jgi:hypothetical protein